LKTGELAAVDQLAYVLITTPKHRRRFGPKQHLRQVREDWIE
jgi:hypothetical protein